MTTAALRVGPVIGQRVQLTVRCERPVDSCARTRFGALSPPARNLLGLFSRRREAPKSGTAPSLVEALFASVEEERAWGLECLLLVEDEKEHVLSTHT